MAILSEGQKIRDTYVVERFLGEGAFAEVYRVQHKFLGRQAMKVFKGQGQTLKEIEELLSEALLLSKIGHPNIIRVYDANVLETSDGEFGFFTMEYIAGGNLHNIWKSYGNKLMPIDTTLDIIKQICIGMSVAHNENPPIVHRDIKPHNVLIGYDGAGMRVRLGDFGLAKSVNPLTLLVSARGTLSFKPPEAFDNHDSPAADVWAIGTIFYLLLTDSVPFPELDGRDISDASRFVNPLRAASDYNMSVDPSLNSILFRCMAIDQSSRYHNASALLSDLNNWKPNTNEFCDDSNIDVNKGLHFNDTGDVIMKANNQIQQAMLMANSPGKLIAAADMLEEAISFAPTLRAKYECLLRLWRQGVCM